MLDNIAGFLTVRRERAAERGASAVEYGLLIAGIAALIVVAVFALGPVVRDAFSDTCTTISQGDANADNDNANCEGDQP